MIAWLISIVISYFLIRTAIKIHGISRDNDTVVLQLFFNLVLVIIPLFNLFYGFGYLIFAFFASRGLSAREWIKMIFKL